MAQRPQKHPRNRHPERERPAEDCGMGRDGRPVLSFICSQQRARSGQEFQFASPDYEPDLNGRGRIRIDYEAAHQISIEKVEKFPWLLKTLSLGTQLDVDLMEQLFGLQWHTLGAFWKSFDKTMASTGQGYDRSPRTRSETC